MPMIIDCHVHVVGDGSNGSGCWVDLKRLNFGQKKAMLSTMGLASNVVGESLDQSYIERLESFVRESSLDKVVILASEMPYDKWGNKILGVAPFYVPNGYVLSLAKEREIFIPAISIHPAKPGAIEELESSYSAGARILKLLPNFHNVDCRDTRFKPFWRRMAELGMIFLAHTGDELTLPVINKDFEDPEVLRGPLEEGVKVIAAHSASSTFIARGFFEKFISMTKEHSNLWGDISALATPLRARFFRPLLNDSELQDRLIYGSDLPVPVVPLSAALWGVASYRDTQRLSQIDNPLERDFQLKKLIGFSDDVFTRLSTMIGS